MQNRKRVRGWKRQMDRVRAWRDAHARIDTQHYEASDFDDVKLTLDPWYRLVKRQPPVWLRREMTRALLDVEDAWAAQVKQEAMRAPYLSVWLQWPNFIRSQVVIARNDRALMYETMFHEAPDPRGLPHDLGPELHARLGQYTWRECLSEVPVLAEDLTPEDHAWLAKRRHRTERLSDRRTIHWVQEGRLWVLQRRLA